jgi:hypothetical protein
MPTVASRSLVTNILIDPEVGVVGESPETVALCYPMYLSKYAFTGVVVPDKEWGAGSGTISY